MKDIVIVEWDKVRELRFGHKAQKIFEQLTGKPLSQLDPDNIGADEVEKLLYCMMLSDAQKKGEDLKLSDMEDILDSVSPYSAIMKAFSDTLNAAMTIDGEQGKNVKKAK
jgi:hypothetical protein